MKIKGILWNRQKNDEEKAAKWFGKAYRRWYRNAIKKYERIIRKASRMGLDMSSGEFTDSLVSQSNSIFEERGMDERIICDMETEGKVTLSVTLDTEEQDA